MSSKAALLNELMGLHRPIDQIINDLAAFGWDSDVELVHLQRQHISNLLHRFIEGDANVPAAVVRAWAESIEGRDDIGFEEGAEELLKKITFELANPEITEPLTPHNAKELIDQLGVKA